MSATDIPGVISASGSQTATDQGEYWELDVHSTSVLEIGSRTLEGVLINTNNNICQINATGDSWVIRNVGFKGKFPNEDNGANIAIAVSGSGLMEHVYLGDGGYGDWREKHQDGTKQFQPTGVYGTPGNTGGSITIRDVYCAGWTDNGMYLEQSGGRIDYTIERVYGHDNDVSMIRPGRGNHTVRDCHGHGNTHRDFWNRVGSTVTLTNCQFETARGSYDTEGDTAVGSSANPQRPGTVPKNPMQGATGESDGAGTTTDPACVRDIV